MRDERGFRAQVLPSSFSRPSRLREIFGSSVRGAEPRAGWTAPQGAERRVGTYRSMRTGGCGGAFGPQSGRFGGDPGQQSLGCEGSRRIRPQATRAHNGPGGRLSGQDPGCEGLPGPRWTRPQGRIREGVRMGFGPMR